MKKHIEFLGIAYIVCLALTIFTIMVALVILFGLGVFVDARQFHDLHPWHGPTAAEFLITAAFFIFGLLFLLSIPGIIAGIGLLKMRPWSRFLTLILGCFNLLNIPFGTTLGIYSVWVLMQTEAISLLSKK